MLPLPAGLALPSGSIKLGVRPEYVVPVAPHAPGALPMTVVQVQDVGTHLMLSANYCGQTIKARLASHLGHWTSGDAVWLQVLGEQTCFYKNEEIVA